MEIDSKRKESYSGSSVYRKLLPSWSFISKARSIKFFYERVKFIEFDVLEFYRRSPSAKKRRRKSLNSIDVFTSAQQSADTSYDLTRFDSKLSIKKWSNEEGGGERATRGWSKKEMRQSLELSSHKSTRYPISNLRAERGTHLFLTSSFIRPDRASYSAARRRRGAGRRESLSKARGALPRTFRKLTIMILLTVITR